MRDGKTKDYDLYLTNMGAARVLAQFYIEKFKSAYTDANVQFNRLRPDIGQDAFEIHIPDGIIIKNEGTDLNVPTCITNTAISLRNRVQIIFRFTGSPEDVTDKFDFEHTRCWYSKDTGLQVNREAVESALSRELIYTGSEYPVSSMMRAKRFVDRGWNISAGQQLKIALDISKLDLENPVTLRDQLIGVDLMLFNQLLRRVELNEEARIIDLIDEVF